MSQNLTDWSWSYQKHTLTHRHTHARARATLRAEQEEICSSSCDKRLISNYICMTDVRAMPRHRVINVKYELDTISAAK